MPRSVRIAFLIAVGGIIVLPAAAPAARPRVVILANNSGAETTDLLTPFAILTDANVADVSIVAVAPGPVALMPGLTILPDTTLAEVATPPDVVIIPAMHDPTAAPLLEAVRAWAAGGALMVSICEGARVLANAGLLEGRRATSHWYAIPSLRKAFPHTVWQQDVRWVRDGNVITSAGVSASEPLARHLAALLHGDDGGSRDGDGPAHDGASFAVSARDVATGALNYLSPWRWDVVAIGLRDGVDEIALSVGVDLLARTYAVRTVTFAATSPVRGRRGLRLIPDVIGAKPPADRVARLEMPDVDALLADIEQRYGAATRSLVALQIEYPSGR